MSNIKSGENVLAVLPAPAVRSRPGWISAGIGGWHFQSLALTGFLLALIAAFAFASPYFLTIRNMTNILLSVAVIGTIAPVMTLVLIARHFDLSIGSIIGLVSVTAGLLLADQFPVWLVIALSLATGLASGLLNGALIVGLRIDSIIVTIGTLSILRGLAYVISDSQTVIVDSDFILALGSGRIFGLPYSVLIMLGVFVACHIVAVHTRSGRSIYAIGANPRASLLSGIAVERYKFYVFAASGTAAALSALLFIGQTASATPSAGVAYELQVLTAVLLGGTSLYGGRGHIFGTLLGVLIIGVLNNGMVLLGVNSHLQVVTHGVLLLVAVGLDRFQRKDLAYH